MFLVVEKRLKAKQISVVNSNFGLHCTVQLVGNEHLIWPCNSHETMYLHSCESLCLKSFTAEVEYAGNEHNLSTLPHQKHKARLCFSVFSAFTWTLPTCLFSISPSSRVSLASNIPVFSWPLNTKISSISFPRLIFPFLALLLSDVITAASKTCSTAPSQVVEVVSSQYLGFEQCRCSGNVRNRQEQYD